MKTYEYRYLVEMFSTVQAETISEAAFKARGLVARVKEAQPAVIRSATLSGVVQIDPPLTLSGAAPSV